MGGEFSRGLWGAQYFRVYMGWQLSLSWAGLLGGSSVRSPAWRSILKLSCACLFQTSEEILQHLQNIVDFGKNVMKDFLGENYVHCGVSVTYLHFDFHPVLC